MILTLGTQLSGMPVILRLNLSLLLTRTSHHVGGKTDKFGRVSAHTINIGAEAHVGLQVAAFYPAQLRQLVPQNGVIGIGL